MKTETQKKIRKMTPYTKQWYDEAYSLAMSYCPPIKACRECGHPVVIGYCCGTCESMNP